MVEEGLRTRDEQIFLPTLTERRRERERPDQRKEDQIEKKEGKESPEESRSRHLKSSSLISLSSPPLESTHSMLGVPSFYFFHKQTMTSLTLRHHR